MTKHCGRCKTKKSVPEFGRDRNSKDGMCCYCRQCRSDLNRADRQRSVQKRAAYAKTYWRENKEYTSSVQKVWRDLNRAQIAARGRARYIALRDRYKANASQWYRANTHKVAAIGRRKDALKRGAAISDLTHGEWQILKDEFAHCCAYCGERSDELTQDHVMALSVGGSHTYENVVPACRSCNSRKGAKSMEEFLCVAS